MADTPEPAGRATRLHPDGDRAFAEVEAIRRCLDAAAGQLQEAYRRLHHLALLIAELERR